MDTKDVTNRLSTLSATEIAGGAIGFSLLAALTTMAVTSLRRRLRSPDRPPAPVEPMGDAVMPAHIPNHFSEGIVVPGFTETGADVVRDDDNYGRSPEGV